MKEMKYIPALSDPYISVYENRCRLSRGACLLLGLSGKFQRVRLICDEINDGRSVIYFIGRGNTSFGYQVRNRRYQGEINNVKLAKELSRNLNGPGTYRILPDNTRQYDGTIFYAISFINIH